MPAFATAGSSYNLTTSRMMTKHSWRPGGSLASTCAAVRCLNEARYMWWNRRHGNLPPTLWCLLHHGQLLSRSHIHIATSKVDTEYAYCSLGYYFPYDDIDTRKHP